MARDWPLNVVAKTLEEVPLLKEPRHDAEDLGWLPVGSVVTVLGEQRDGFLLVEVSLVDGKQGGWIEEVVLEPLKAGEKTDRKRKRLTIPQDERLLIKREPVFFYGGQFGLNWSHIQSGFNGLTYSGFGFLVGAHAGTFLSPTFPIRFEVNYSQLNGSHELDAVDEFGFSFLEIGVVPAISWSTWEVFFGLHYSFGLSVNELVGPVARTFEAASDLSALWGQLGFGYRFPVGDLTHVAFRLRYGVAFSQDPFAYHLVTGMMAIDLRG